MLINPDGLEVYNLVWVISYIQTLCTGAAKAQTSLQLCADSSEPSLPDVSVSIKISYAGPFELTNMYISSRNGNNSNYYNKLWKKQSIFSETAMLSVFIIAILRAYNGCTVCTMKCQLKKI